MKNKLIAVFAIVAMGVAIFGAAGVDGVYAAITPTLSLSSVSGDTVQINAYGDANAAVMLYYNVASPGGMQSLTLGTTNGSGSFSTTLSSSQHGIIAGDSAYVLVDGAQSSMQAWPAPTGTPNLSQTSVTIGLGQSITVYSQGSTAPVYMSTNANPNVASVQANGGQQITVVGNQLGATTAVICYTGTASACTSLYITVQNGNVLTLSFNQNNVTLGIGQSMGITVSGGNGTYTITGNTNPSAVTAVLSGNTITATGETAGTANIAVCDSSGNCNTLIITAGTATTGSLYFSVSNPSLTVGQVTTVTINGGSGYYVTGNSNASVASQSINGNVLTISGLESGVTTMTVCSTSNGCGSLSVTVNGTVSGTGAVTFGVMNPTLTPGQTLNVALSGGGSYYLSSNANASVIQASVSGITLSLYAASVGSDSILVCVSGGSCNTLYASVGATSNVTPTTPTGIAANAGTLLSTMSSMQTQLAQIVQQIQSMESTLVQLASSVSASVGKGVTTGTQTPAAGTSYNFTEFLSIGSQDAQVTALQQYLAGKGFYTGPITGYFGTLTEDAVGRYQTAHSIDPAGYVGPSTRTALNAGE